MENGNNGIKTAVQPIPYKQLMAMHGHYLKKKHKILSAVLEQPETKSIWYEKNADFDKFLQDFLASSSTGLRVYLCEYDDATLPPDVNGDPERKDKYLKKLTIGFVATKLNDDGTRHVDDVKETEMLVFNPYNHGKICPPDICPEG